MRRCRTRRLAPVSLVARAIQRPVLDKKTQRCCAHKKVPVTKAGSFLTHEEAGSPWLEQAIHHAKLSPSVFTARHVSTAVLLCIFNEGDSHF